MTGRHERPRPQPQPPLDPDEAARRADLLARADDAERRGLRYVPRIYRMLAEGHEPKYGYWDLRE